MSYTPAPGKEVWRTTFSKAIANNVDSTYWDLIRTGSGQTVNQTGGNLVVTTGTTVNSETIIRSKASWKSFTYFMSYGLALSQRIANQNFFVELVDVVGDNLSYTINSATSVTVTFPTTNPFTSANVGQSMYLGNLSSVGIPVRAAIASVSGLTVTFTVAGWPASGSGTLSLFGHSYQQVLYDGTTATNAKYDAQRHGFNTGFTTATINTTASTGHVAQIFQEESMSLFGDCLAASSTVYQVSQRASRMQNIPNTDAPLYFQIRVLNGSTAPASTTTLTMNFTAVEQSSVTPVVIENGSQLGAGASIPTWIMGSATIPTTATVTGYPTAAAAGDGYANPTITHLGADNFRYNGSTWDRFRNNINVGLGDTGVKTATFNGASFNNWNGLGAVITVIVTAVSGTSPTMTCQLQWSPDSGTTWLNYGSPTAALTAAGTAVLGFYPTQWSDATATTLSQFTLGATVSKLHNAPLPRTARIVYTIGGTTPSFTLSNTYISTITV